MKNNSIKFFVIICVTVFLINLPTTAYSQTTPDYNQVSKIIANIYSCYFGSAKKKIQAFIDENPESPVGFMLRGMYYEWYQVTRNKKKSLNGTIMQNYQKAKDLAETALQKNKNDLNTKMLLGNAYMYVAKKQIDNGKKMAAGSSLKKAKKIMEDVISRDPQNNNAYFAIGLFNYFAENVPSGLKWLAALLGFRGNEAKGLSYIKRAASSRNITQMDAKFMMVYIYARKQNNFNAALPFARQLYKQFPNNPIFLFNYAEMQFRTKAIAGSRQSFNKFFAYCDKYKGRCSKQNIFLSNLFMAWGYINEKDYKTAKDYVLEADSLRNFAGTKDRVRRIDDWKKKVL